MRENMRENVRERGGATETSAGAREQSDCIRNEARDGGMSERINDQAAVRRREREHSGETSKMAPGMHNAHHHHHNRHDSGNSQSIPAKVGNADGGSPVVTFNPKVQKLQNT